MGRELEALAERLADGSMAPLIMHAAGSKKLTARERREIRELLRRRK
jgi:predicted transcriptional regulator